MFSLLDLLTVPDSETVFQGEVLPALRGRGLTVTAWAPLDPCTILARTVAMLRQMGRQAIASRTAGGFGEYVFGNQAPPGGLDVTGWAARRAASWYGVKVIDATRTKRTITLTNATAAAYGPIAQGGIICKFPSGNRYILDDDAVTIPANNVDIGFGNGVLKATFRSEFAVDSASGRTYSDGPGSSPIALVTAQFSGVVATNPAPAYSAVSQLGYGLGTLTLTGAPTGSHTVAARIDSNGQSGVATWSLSVDGGAYVSQGASATSLNVGGFGANIALANGASSPSFLAESVYYFSWPGSDVTVLGRDAETPQQLGSRCYALWPILSFAKDANGNWLPTNPPLSAVEALTRSASDQVAVCLVRTDGALNNKVHILVAGQGGLLPTSTITVLQAFWNTFTGLTDLYVLAAPATTAVTLAGATVTVRASAIGAAQAAAQSRVRAYLTGVDANNRLTIGDGSTVLIDRSYLNSLLRSTGGVLHLDDGLTINGAATDLVVPLDHLATYGSGDVATSLTWVPG